MGDRRLGDGTQPQRADGDAELVDRRSSTTCSPSPAASCGRARAGLGARLDLGTAGRDQGELRADEERVAEQQDERERDRGAGAHRSPRPGAWPARRELVEQAQGEPVDAAGRPCARR